MDKLSHSDALSVVKKWFLAKKYKIIAREGVSKKSYHNIDLVAKDEYGDYVVCEVKCSQQDLSKAEYQIDNGHKDLEEVGGFVNVKKYVAITRELYDELNKKDKIYNLVKDMATKHIKVIVVYRTKVKVL